MVLQTINLYFSFFIAAIIHKIFQFWIDICNPIGLRVKDENEQSLGSISSRFITNKSPSVKEAYKSFI